MKEFSVEKNLSHNDVVKIFKKCFWSKELESNEEVVVQVIENWVTDKQNERASRRIFDVKELQLKYKQRDDMLNMIKSRMSID